jgi:hypothetical protein
LIRAGSPIGGSAAPDRTSRQKASGHRGGFSGVTLHDPDRYALELIQEALSDLGSRLFCGFRKTWGWLITSARKISLACAPDIFLLRGNGSGKGGLVEFELLKKRNASAWKV